MKEAKQNIDKKILLELISSGINKRVRKKDATRQTA